MFETSNSDDSTQPKPRPVRKPINKVQFRSLEELSDWIDSQLESLVAEHSEFQTAESNRNYFQRK